MSSANLILLILSLAAVAYFMGRRKSVAIAGGPKHIRTLHSLPSYYGFYCAMWCAIPTIILVLAWGLAHPFFMTSMVADQLPASYQQMTDDELSLVVNDIVNIATGNISNSGTPGAAIQSAADYYTSLTNKTRNLRTLVVLALIAVAFLFTYRRIRPEFRARNRVERLVRVMLIACSSIAILTTIGIFLSVIFESVRFFKIVPLQDFLFGLHWSPQTAIRSDQVGSSGSFGAIPLFTGTLLIASIAMAVAAPLGLMTAIYLSEYASQKFRSFAKPALEVLAGIPTVVYGFFAVTTVGPLIAGAGQALGMDVSQGAALGVGLVMGVMIIPFVSSLSDDVINAVPQAMRDGSYGLGATRSETIKRVILPAALPGIVGGLLLAVSRAIGETMIVVMAAGLSANLTANPLEVVTTVTAQIVNLLVGDQEFDSAKTLAAFALGLVLFLVTLALNIIALRVVRNYREQYS